MQTISKLKEQAVSDTPLIVFDCVLPNGDTEHWSTHAITVNNVSYLPRVIQHSAFDIQTASDQGVDGSPKISILLANADSHFSEVDRSTGWKGARLTVGFLFYDLRGKTPLTDLAVVFQGICNPPDQIKEATFRLTATNRMNLQRLLLPEVRIQRRCPWQFPATPEQRQEALDGGSEGRYSFYYRCGYSADITGGKGNLNNGTPFTSCSFTRSDCEARGMFSRFGGLEFVPSVIAVRGYGKDWTNSNLSINQARYNDFVPMVYGTAWYEPLAIFARNDGNLTRMEVLLGIGPMQGVITVLVNGVELPVGVSGKNMAGTGWYNVVSLGARDGAFDLNFTDSSGQPAGDPYGSMAYLSVVVPNQLSDGNSLPSLKVLAQGLVMPMYDAQGNPLPDAFSSNPAWILLDVLRRSGWDLSEIDLLSFARAATYCDETITAKDLNGNTISLPRFQCNLVLQNRRSAGDLVRGVRNAARLFLTYGAGGVLQLQVENTTALQQPTKPDPSNSTEVLDGGWPSYEFGDGSTGFSGIARRQNGEPSVTLTARAIADTPNRYTVEFQDSLNGYQQDSFSAVNADDIALAGQEVSASLLAIGLPNYDQAARILQFNLDKSVRGNRYIEFQTSVRAFGIRQGDLITITYLKEGYNRQPFRVLKISPATNYRTSIITAQIHDDAWYADSNGQSNSFTGINQGGGVGNATPRPLIGTVLDPDGNIQFGVTETDTPASDGTVDAAVSLSFIVPSKIVAAGPGIPLIDLSPQLTSEGRLQAGEILYYAVTAQDSAGAESGPSFIVRAITDLDGTSVILSGLSFPSSATAFNVYRGQTPTQLFRIASAQPIAAQFTDPGLEDELVAPPDPNFDHANFYWRMESLPEMPVTIHSAANIGNNTLSMTKDAFRGLTARITRGMGAGQEATVLSNDATMLSVAPQWTIEPDATSFFVVAESAWHFGAISSSSPVQFSIPNRAGEVVHLTGRAANANDVEGAPQISIVTRWQIGGSGNSDEDVPPAPTFGVGLGKAGGTLELSGISFNDLTNTRTILAATTTVYYWDELQPKPTVAVATALAAADATLQLSGPGAAEQGVLIQIEAEIMQVTAVSNGGAQYTVTRGVNGSAAAAHAAGATVYQLVPKTLIVPFPPGFFGSPYSGSWTYSIPLPDVRVSSVQMFVTNDRGNGPPANVALTHNVDMGLRTLSGGQYSIQVDGYLSVDQLAAPALVVDAPHSVRDVFAVLGTSADAPVQLQVNVGNSPYCQITIPPGLNISNSADGLTLPPLAAGAQVTLSILSVGQSIPGADLTVLVRL